MITFREILRLTLPLVLASCVAPSLAAVHVWEKQELTFNSARPYTNAYTDVTVWVDLTGPDFKKRVYGFWDDGQTFRVRLVATEPGTWTWTSGSSPADEGLAGKSGSFEAMPWSEEEKQANPLRRGFLRSTPNHHALEQADGTPFFVIGDTWWPLGANRFRWYDDDQERPIGPTAGFKDFVRYRKAQGYNWINMIAAFPNWMTDGQPWHVVMNDPARTTVRSAWLEFGANSAKNMDNEGGRPFLFPGKVHGYENMFPDVNRINPEYFRYVDRKIDYLNEQGFVPFIEVSRRDASLCWKKYYDWPDSYARFIQYIWSRYQANNTVLSPVHLDVIQESVGPEDYLAAIRQVKDKYGMPPFGTLLSANANPSTLENWGDDSWVTLHQIGNKREHNNYWYLTEIFRSPHPQPALNGEPYYSGYVDARSVGYKYGAPGGTEKDDQFVRSAMYGCFLSGGLAGHVYGAEGIWGGDIEGEAPIKMWDAFQWNSGKQMQHLRTFALSIGKRYQELVPYADLVSPNKSAELLSYEGWAYCARTPDKNLFLVYFEKGCPRGQLRGAKPLGNYQSQWFDPRNGTWQDAGGGTLRASNIGIIGLPACPSDNDWGMRLMCLGPDNDVTPVILKENESSVPMKLVIGSDHAGFPLKGPMIKLLQSWNYSVKDVGSFDPDPVDFPDIAVLLADEIVSGRADRGIMVCGTGVGAAIACNKIQGIRAALCHDTYSAHQCVEHDNVNVLCIGAQIIGPSVAAEILTNYLNAKFSTEEQFQRRVKKLDQFDRVPPK